MTARATDEVSGDLRRMVMSGLALAPAGANVVMQLSRLAVGHGVAESRVESGALLRHPVKRTRTTLAYVLVSLLGDETEREALRRDVNRQHRLVRSRSGDPVVYDAFDPELQLWVAACMYRGAHDAATTFFGAWASRPDSLDELYRRCSRFATTLQVDPSRWPATRDDFDEYWREALAHVAMDEATRDYLRRVVSLEFLPWVLRWWLGPAHRFVTTGFLPARFRDELGLSWGRVRQSAFTSLMAFCVWGARVAPRVVREFPLNWILWDTRRRIARGRSVV